jgi:ribonuclease BN (tRNA processing enzyme)
MIDAGEAVVFQLARAGQSNPAHVFLTHLHNDHTAGLFSLATFGRGITVYGPPRTSAFVSAIAAAIAFNTEIRTAENPGRGGGGPGFTGQDVQPGVVYKDQNVLVEAIENTHFHITSEPASRNKSYSYKVRTPDRVFVFTGDTGWSDPLVKFASGADVLVSEMISSADWAAVTDANRFHTHEEHLSPTMVGKLAGGAKVKLVIVTHTRPRLPEDMAEIRRQCGCVAVMGEDLMRF